MAKGVLAFLKSVFSKPVIKTQETVATTLTNKGTVVKKALDSVSKDKLVQHIYAEGSHMADLGVRSTTLRQALTPNNMAMHGGKPYYAFSSLNVKLNNGKRLSFYSQEEARKFFSTANAYHGYMTV